MTNDYEIIKLTKSDKKMEEKGNSDLKNELKSGLL